jgi:hypothetical protein
LLSKLANSRIFNIPIKALRLIQEGKGLGIKELADGLEKAETPEAAEKLVTTFLENNGAKGYILYDVDKGFKSFDALKKAIADTYGPIGDGNVLHHIVEQRNAGRFGEEAIHNFNNVTPVSAAVNNTLNRIYSSIRADITGSKVLTVRQWMDTKSFDKQYKFGIEALENVLSGVWQ